MAVETSSELLDFTKEMSGRPTLDNEMTSTKWYRLLTLAQKELFEQIATHAPGSQVGAPVKLTTSDEGYTYDFAAYPWGRVEVRESRTGNLLIPGPEWDDSTDIVIEGDKLRFPGNRQRTFGDGPYARYAAEPGELDASTEPTLQPPSARVLICWRALEMWASKGSFRDPAFYARELQKGLWGDPHMSGYVGLIPKLKNQFAFQDSGGGGYDAWWRNGDLENHF